MGKGVEDQLDDNLLEKVCDEEDARAATEWCKSMCPRSDIFESRLEKADELRDDGNGALQLSEKNENNCPDNLAVAKRRYLAALHHVDFDVAQQWQLTSAHEDDVYARKVKILSNLCMVYLKEEAWSAARRAAKVGLETADRLTNIDAADQRKKLLFRRAKATYHLGLFQETIEDCKEALKLGEDPMILKLLRMSEIERRKHEAEANNMWKGKMSKKIEKEAQERIEREQREAQERSLRERRWWHCNWCRRRKKD